MEYSGYLFFLLLCPMPALLTVVSWPSDDTNAVDKIGGNDASRHIKEVIINQEKSFSTHQSSNLNEEKVKHETDSILLSLPKKIGKITKFANTLKAKRKRWVKRTLCSCENIDVDCLPECSDPCPCTTAAPTPKIHIIQTPERPPVQSPPVIISPQNPPPQQNIGPSPPVIQPLTNTVPANAGTIGLHPGVVPGQLGTGNAYIQPQSQQTVLLPIPPNPVTNPNQATNLGYSQASNSGAFSRNQFTYSNPGGLNMVNPGVNPVTHQSYIIPTNYVPLTTANGIPTSYTITAPSMISSPYNQQALPGYPNTNQGNFAPQTSNGLHQINPALASNNVGSQGSSYGYGGASFGNQGSYGNQGANYGNQGNSNSNQAPNSNNQRPNFGSQRTSYGNQGSNSNNQRPNYGTQGSNGGNQGPSTGNQGSSVNNQRANHGNQGSSSNNKGSNAGNQGTSYGNQGSDLNNQETNSVDQGSSQGQSSANKQSSAGNQGSNSGTTAAPNHVPISAIEVPHSLGGNSQPSPNPSNPRGNSGNTGNANPPSSTISTGPTNPQPQTNNPFAPGGSLSTSKATPTRPPTNNARPSQNVANNIQSNPSVEKHSDRKEDISNHQHQKLESLADKIVKNLERKPETGNEEAKKTGKVPLKNLIKKLLKKLSKNETSVSEEKGKSTFLKKMTSRKAASPMRKVNKNHSRQTTATKRRKGKLSRQKLSKGASKNSTHGRKIKFYNRKVAWKKVWKEIADDSS